MKSTSGPAVSKPRKTPQAVLDRLKAQRDADPEKYLERARQNRERNRERINARRREARKKDPEAARQKDREGYISNRDNRRKSTDDWKRRNIEQQRMYRRERFKKLRQDKVEKAKHNIAGLIRSSISNPSPSKAGTKFEIIVGICKEDFRRWIESQFEPWMNWGNYGFHKGSAPSSRNQCWDIDHINPISTAVTVADVERLSHHTNLRPLCSWENRWGKSSHSSQPPESGAAAGD
jgi:hypothetical protein